MKRTAYHDCIQNLRLASLNRLASDFGKSCLYIVLYCALLMPAISNAQAVRRIVSTSISDYASGMEKLVVMQNQLYVYGFGGKNLRLTYKHNFQVNATRKLFISKYNDTGVYTGAKTFGGFGANVNGYACAFGSDVLCFSGVYSGGYAEGDQTVISGSKKGMFVTAVDSSLSAVWRLFLDANDKFHCNLLCPDGKGNLYAAGYFSDSLRFGAKKFISTRIPGQVEKNKDIFLLLINSSGNIISAQTFGGHGNDYPTSLVADASGNAILTAIISDTVKLGDYEYLQQSKSRSIVFKCNMLGHTYWVTGFVGTGATIYGLAYNNKHELICGADFKYSLFIKSATRNAKLGTDGAYNQIAVVVLDTFGNLLNYKTEGSQNSVTLRGMALDASGNIFISGEFQCTFTALNQQNSWWSFKNIGFGDIYLAAYSASLSPLYQRQTGGNGADRVGHLITWHNRPLVCGGFVNDIQLQYDSNVLITRNNAGNGGGYQKVYYTGVNNGPYYKRATETSNPWTTESSGFFSDMLDIKARVFNNYQFINKKGDEYQENAIWEHDLFNTSPEFCYQGRMRFYWLEQYLPSAEHGTMLEYWINGKLYTQEKWREYTFTNSGFYTLIVNTADHCYADTLEENFVVKPMDYVTIDYDKVKFPGGILLCNDNDSACFTAGNTKGLKFYWRVRYYDYALDSGNVYDPEISWKLRNYKTDTLFNSTICVKEKADVYLQVEKNSHCLEGRNIGVRKDSLGKDDSIVCFFTDTNDFYCKGENIQKAHFSIRVLDKKSGFYRYVLMTSELTVNGKKINSSYQDDYELTVPDTGNIKITGIIKVGCRSYNISAQREVKLQKPKATILGSLSNCHSAEQIFTADSGYMMYDWNLGGLPDTPKITYLKPWKIKVSGSVWSVSLAVYSDTADGEQCYDYINKSSKSNPPVHITASSVPAQLCPGKKITLTANLAKEYSWFPTGETTQSISVSEPGVYYCTGSDTGDCPYSSNKIDVLGFYEPDIIVEPDNIVCSGEEVTIRILAPQTATISWAPPSGFGNNRVVKTKKRGTFYCNVTTCGKTYQLAAVIIDKPLYTYTRNLNVEICKGQSYLMLSHDTETYAYQWLPMGGSKRGFSTNVSGIFTVQARDQCGNWYNSDIYTITENENTSKSTTFDTLICGVQPLDVDLQSLCNLSPDSLYTIRWLHDGDANPKKTLPPGSGNYTISIKSKYCSVADTFKLGITNVNKTTVKVQPVMPVCFGDSIQLTATLSDTQTAKTKIFWSHNLGNGDTKKMPVLKSEWVYASISDTCGNSKDSVRVSAHILKAAYDIAYYVEEDEVVLTERCSGNNIVSFKWYVNGVLSGTDRVLRMPSPLTPDAVVCLAAENGAGCLDSTCKTLPIYNKGQFYIPTAFRPTSGIAKNQRFQPFSKVQSEYTMLIYSRWGEKLFEGGSNTNGWDGTYMGNRCPNGSYAYIIQLKYTDIKGQPATRLFKGMVTIQE